MTHLYRAFDCFADHCFKHYRNLFAGLKNTTKRLDFCNNVRWSFMGWIFKRRGHWQCPLRHYVAFFCDGRISGVLHGYNDRCCIGLWSDSNNTALTHSMVIDWASLFRKNQNDSTIGQWVGGYHANLVMETIIGLGTDSVVFTNLGTNHLWISCGLVFGPIISVGMEPHGLFLVGINSLWNLGIYSNDSPVICDFSGRKIVAI